MKNRSLEVLLVEDNVADVDLVREAFKQSKVILSLHVVDRGETAMAYLNSENEYAGAPRPDLVLLDLNLPGIDGREVLHFIKTSEHLKSIPVVILTSSEADMDILKTYSWGANAYVVKPVGFPEFLRAISTIEEFWLDLVKLPTRELQLRYQLNRSGIGPRFVVSAGPTDSIRTLVVEDNDADADLVLETLKKSTHPKFTTQRVTRLAEAHERLKQGHVDLILLDLSLPDSQGFETIASIQHAFPFLPIVILSGLDDPDMSIRAVKEGLRITS
jgi:CheY-like chemotaxis protein